MGGTASSKFLESNDITVTKFLDTTVTKFPMDRDTAVTKFLDANDVSVTKFLDSALASYLLDDRVVTNFLESNATPVENDLAQNAVQENVTVDQDGDTLMVTFLEQSQAPNDTSVTKFLDNAFS